MIPDVKEHLIEKLRTSQTLLHSIEQERKLEYYKHGFSCS